MHLNARKEQNEIQTERQRTEPDNFATDTFFINLLSIGK